MKRSKAEELLRKKGLAMCLDRRTPNIIAKYNSFNTVHVSSFVKGGMFIYDALVEESKKPSPVDK